MYTGNPPLEPWETDDWQWFNHHRQVVTETDWLSCPNPVALLEYLTQKDTASRRKFFLAGAACVRRVWHLLERPESRAAVEAAELFADGYISRDELGTASLTAVVYDQFPPVSYHFCAALAASRLRHDIRHNHGNAEETVYVLHSVSDAVAVLAGAERSDEWEAARIAEMRGIADLYRCVMGNPFQPVTFAPSWRTGTAVSLARGMYESRDFSAVPILADALQDAGCNEPALLDHCRDTNQTRVRGCWAVDLVLGLE